MDPKNPAGYFNLAVQAERMKKFNQAIDAYRTFLKLSDQNQYSTERKRAEEALSKLVNANR